MQYNSNIYRTMLVSVVQEDDLVLHDPDFQNFSDVIIEYAFRLFIRMVSLFHVGHLL